MNEYLAGIYLLAVCFILVAVIFLAAPLYTRLIFWCWDTLDSWLEKRGYKL